MAKATDLVGNVYGKLTVLARADNDRHGNSRWICRCSCPAATVTPPVLGLCLRRGNVKSCGCMPRGPSRRPRHPSLSHQLVKRRVELGWDYERAISTPCGPVGRPRKIVSQ